MFKIVFWDIVGRNQTRLHLEIESLRHRTIVRFHNKYQQTDVAQGNKRCLLCETRRNT